ncbi:beta-ketoacyl-ACP synthase II [Salinispira pacifica]|uniref:3-oxoacyl-[acyl-carrier-protein] synthase 2 n=1 Tax=Salinispira pacifica TaxID=1307761 RepID=V5WDG9_9SPIO|nr:beta-ketoacyl-ACP synthase II [Salinispira pacifica]AHC13599.1 3-oxoacyl-[acyl-carrier-protein] synthase, KASII [Salinispira pacifica]
MARRVVITGMGSVNPLGHNVKDFWKGIREGRSGVGPITHFDPSEHATRIAAEIKDFNVRDFMDPKEAKKLEPFSQFAVVSAYEAWAQAGFQDGDVDPVRVGCILGVGIGGFSTLEKSFHDMTTRGPRRVHPMTIPKLISNIGPGNVAIYLNAQGPAYSLATACASGTDAIGHGMRNIQDGITDVVITGGVEATITPLGIAAFNAIHALSTAYNDEPQRASRPFDKDRDGFVMGEGAGILILEELEHARKRGAQILAEVVANGASTDASHLTAPHPQGRGAILAINHALRQAGITPEQIDYINAHGTSTPINDPTETRAIKQVFGEYAKKLKVSSTKSMTGHCIGAAGALEAIICTKAIEDQFFPATINYENPDPECDLDYVPNKGVSGKIEYTMSNSLGFGGHNSILILKRFQD